MDDAIDMVNLNEQPGEFVIKDKSTQYKFLIGE